MAKLKTCVTDQDLRDDIERAIDKNIQDWGENLKIMYSDTLVNVGSAPMAQAAAIFNFGLDAGSAFASLSETAASRVAIPVFLAKSLSDGVASIQQHEKALLQGIVNGEYQHMRNAVFDVIDRLKLDFWDTSKPNSFADQLSFCLYEIYKDVDLQVRRGLPRISKIARHIKDAKIIASDTTIFADDLTNHFKDIAKKIATIMKYFDSWVDRLIPGGTDNIVVQSGCKLNSWGLDRCQSTVMINKDFFGNHDKKQLAAYLVKINEYDVQAFEVGGIKLNSYVTLRKKDKVTNKNIVVPPLAGSLWNVLGVLSATYPNQMTQSRVVKVAKLIQTTQKSTSNHIGVGCKWQ